MKISEKSLPTINILLKIPSTGKDISQPAPILYATQNYVVTYRIEDGILQDDYQLCLFEPPRYQRIAANGNKKYLIRLANYLERKTDWQRFYKPYKELNKDYINTEYKQLVIYYLYKQKQFSALVGRKSI